MNTTKKILILSANPKDTARLRLDEEVREIKEGLKLSKQRDQYIIHQAWAVRLRDLRRALLEYEPHIVHFCGHGEETGLMVENEQGKATLVSSGALSGLFELFSDSVECVFLNACYSQLQAEAINQHIPYVIGMRQGITDKAAIEFAVGFYDALGAGKSIEEAFKFGRNAIQLYNIPEHLTPILLEKYDEQTQEEQNNNENQIAVRNSGDLVIQSALYGLGARYIDVTEEVQKEVIQGRLQLLVSNLIAGDPLPGTRKNLTVVFSYRGQRYTRIVHEGEVLALP